MLTILKRGLTVLPLLLAGSSASFATTPAPAPTPAAPPPAAAAVPASPLGVWIDHTGRGAVEITDCNGALCGRVVWLKAASHGEACNMQVIGNAKPSGRRWSGGWIYDPEAKSKYDLELTPISGDKLRVFGYAGMRLFGETMIWTRAPAELQRCDQVAAAKPEPAKTEAAAPAATAPAPAKAAAPPAPKAKSAAAPSEQKKAERPAKTERTAKADRPARARKSGTEEAGCVYDVPDLGKVNIC